MNNTKLMSPYTLGSIELKNRIVMAPMTRCRAIDNIPNILMAEYYKQRSAAGLIITEGTSPSPNGLGYCRIPGIYSELQTEGWKKITEAVHSKDSKIFVQLMHTGRISHPHNMPKDSVIMAPSALKPAGQMWTDVNGLQDFPMPKEMTLDEIKYTKQEFVSASICAIKAGLDGIELHAANGYLLEQFLSPISNIRKDNYGDSIQNRCRLLLEIIDETIQAIGKDKIGIRLSPYGVASHMPHYPQIEETYKYLAEKLNRKGILYIHLVDHSSMGAPEVPIEIKQTIRKIFEYTLILSGGYTKDSAEAELESGLANLIAFGRPFINNPDLVERITKGWSLSKDLDETSFYSSDAKGYTDYPFWIEYF